MASDNLQSLIIDFGEQYDAYLESNNDIGLLSDSEKDSNDGTSNIELPAQNSECGWLKWS